MNVAASAIRRWREDPASMVRDLFGVEPDRWQCEVLAAFPKNQRLALKACKGPGKSTVMAWCIWNFLLTRPHPKVVATSISGDNLKDGLWTELAKWQARSELLKGAFEWSAERIISRDHPKTWWASARQWPKSADATQQADTLAGIHADYVLFAIDEAGGIPDGVVAAAEAGLSTGIETKIMLAGNPTHLSGPLYRACTKERALWWVKEISGDPDDPNRAPRIDINWARQQIEKYGKDSPWVLVNVFGKFPPGQSNALLGPDEVTAAAERAIPPSDFRDEPKVLGVDVARFGDDRTVIFPRQGRCAFKPLVFRGLRSNEVVGQVARVIARWKPQGVFVDQGGVGSGPVDTLLALKHDVVGIDFGGKALQGQRYLNRRAEMWGEMAEWVRSGGGLPNEPELVSELTAPTYKFDAHGRIQLESKDDLKKRGLPSPDLADALALTFAMPVANVRQSASPNSDYDPFADRARERVSHEYDPFAERGL